MSVESLEDERDGMRVEGKVGESDGDCIEWRLLWESDAGRVVRSDGNLYSK